MQAMSVLWSLIGQMPFQCCPHLCARAVKKHSLIGVAHIECLRYVGSIPALDVTQGEDESLLLRQRLDHVAHDLEGLPHRGGLVGQNTPGARGRCPVPRVRIFYSTETSSVDPVVVGELRERNGSRLANGSGSNIVGDVHDDAHYPCL